MLQLSRRRPAVPARSPSRCSRSPRRPRPCRRGHADARPSGTQAVNPPSFAGTAGTEEWESGEIAVDIYAGRGIVRRQTASLSASAVVEPRDRRLQRHARRASSPTARTPPARASATAEQETGYSARARCSRSAGREPTPTPTPHARAPRPRRSPTVRHRPAGRRPRPPWSAAESRPPAARYVCASRRDFTKHVLPPGRDQACASSPRSTAARSKSKIGSKRDPHPRRPARRAEGHVHAARRDHPHPRGRQAHQRPSPSSRSTTTPASRRPSRRIRTRSSSASPRRRRRRTAARAPTSAGAPCAPCPWRP